MCKNSTHATRDLFCSGPRLWMLEQVGPSCSLGLCFSKWKQCKGRIWISFISSICYSMYIPVFPNDQGHVPRGPVRSSCHRADLHKPRGGRTCCHASRPYGTAWYFQAVKRFIVLQIAGSYNKIVQNLCIPWLVPWHSELSSCLQHWYFIRAPVNMPAVPILI